MSNGGIDPTKVPAQSNNRLQNLTICSEIFVQDWFAAASAVENIGRAVCQQ
jgi:hypothetical protein